MTDPAKFGQLRTYGRRRGRPLRPQRAGLMRDLLPLIRVPEAAIGGKNLRPRALFDFAPKEVWLELGFGSGEHLAAQARAHPDIGFIGCEVFENGVAALLGRVAAEGLKNIRVHPDDARPLIAALADASVARLFVLFPDPWPKKRHRGRRLVSAAMLGQFARILCDGGGLRLATDDMGYAAEMDALVAAHPDFALIGGGVAAPGATLGAAPGAIGGWRPKDAPQSRYEAKARRLGAVPVFIDCRRRPRSR